MTSENQQQDRFFELLEPELPRLQAFCQKLSGDHEIGDDLLQDALYDAWKSFGGLRREQAFKAWLYQIAINRYRSNLRRFKRQMDKSLPLTAEIADDRQARVNIARDRLHLAMAGLSPKDRALVTLHELEGWSYSDLAAMIGSKEGALRTRLTRCRQRMRETLRRNLEKTDGKSLNGACKKWTVVKQKES